MHFLFCTDIQPSLAIKVVTCPCNCLRIYLTIQWDVAEQIRCNGTVVVQNEGSLQCRKTPAATKEGSFSLLP
jgi:hypothetical protein